MGVAGEAFFLRGVAGEAKELLLSRTLMKTRTTLGHDHKIILLEELMEIKYRCYDVED